MTEKRLVKPLEAASLRLLEGTAGAPAVDTPQAWSVEDEVVDYPPTGSFPEPVTVTHSWRSTVSRGVVGVIAAGIMAAAIFVWGVVNPLTPSTTITDPSQETAAPAITPRLPEVPDAIHKISDDQLYVVLITKDGLWKVTDPAQAVRSAHFQCDYLAKGHTPSEDITGFIAVNATPEEPISIAQARVVVESAIQIYCPEYGR